MSQKNYLPERFQSPEYLAVLADTNAPQTATFHKNALNHMQEIAEAGYPNEICGLLLGDINSQGWNIHQVRQVENINTERAADRFQLDPSGYQAIDREIRGTGVEIIGVFHSHPDCPAKPSPTDLDNAWEGFLYPIISVCDGKVANIRCWEPNDSSGKFHPVDVSKACL